ncbi:hypothetical protein Dimus_039581 [Dionaea muscipula]
MSFVPPIRARLSLPDQEMLEAEQRIAQQTWSVAYSGEAGASSNRSGRGKGMMMMGEHPGFSRRSGREGRGGGRAAGGGRATGGGGGVGDVNVVPVLQAEICHGA